MSKKYVLFVQILIGLGSLTVPVSADTERSSVGLKIPEMPQFCMTRGSGGAFYFDYYPDLKQLEVIKKLIKQGEEILEEDNLSRIQEAVNVFQEALLITQTSNVRSVWEGKVLFQLGEAYFALGSFNKALEHYQSALPLTNRFKSYNRSQEVKTLQAIGKTYRALGRRRQALNTHNEALTIVRGSVSVGNCKREAIARNYMGEIYADDRNLDAASIYFRQASELGSTDWSSIDLSLVEILNNNGKIQVELGNFQPALEFFNKSFQTANGLSQGSRIQLEDFKSTTKIRDFRAQREIEAIRSELRLSLRQLKVTIIQLKQLQPKFVKSEFQSRYADKIRDCEKLRLELMILLPEVEKLSQQPS